MKGGPVRDSWTQPSTAGQVGVGVALDGRIRVELDDAGLVHNVELSPQVMRLQAAELGHALVAVLRQAQQAVQTERERAAGDVSVAERLQALLGEADAVADRRFGEVATALYDLTRRAERTW